MINCNYTVIDEYQFFRIIVSEKHRKSQRVLTPLVARVRAAYQTYLNNFGALCLQQDSLFVADRPKKRVALQKCYSSPTRSFKEFKRDYYDHQPAAVQDLCPFCMIDTPYSLDHYVGQTEFPEYSILTKNLIPCCLKCNLQKNANWRGGGMKIFINFYDDLFLQYRFLYADLLITAGVPHLKFRLVQPLEISDDQFALIGRHFSALGLLDKYARKSHNRLSVEIQTTRALIVAGRSDNVISLDLLIRYRSAVSQYAINYWESLIYLAIANSVAIIRAL